MIYEDISILIKNNKIEEVLKLLETQVKELPTIFQTIYSIQYSKYDTYKSENLIGIEEPNKLIKIKLSLLEIARSIESFQETGQIPPNVFDDNNAATQIHNFNYQNSGTINSRGNVNTGSIVAGGDVNMGGNFYKTVDYNDFLNNIQDLEALVEGATDPQKKQQYLERLINKRKDLEVFKNEIKSLAKTFDEVDLNTERLKIAKAHFDQGEYKEARAVMNSQEVLNEFEQLINKKKQFEKELEKELANTNTALFKKSNEFLILAELTIIDYTNENRYAQADAYYRKSLEAYRYGKNISAYADFAYTHNNFELARNLDEELIGIYKKLVNVDREYWLVFLVNAYLNLARTVLLIGTLAEAREILNIALMEVGNYDSSRDNLLLAVQSMLYQSVANIDRIEQKLEDAALNYEKALSIESILQQTDKEHNELLYIILLNKVIDFYLNTKKLDKVENYLNQVSHQLDSLSKVKKLTPDKYFPVLADFHTNCGIYLSMKKDFEASKSSFDEAIKISRKLLSINKYGYQAFLAATLLKFVKYLPKDNVDKRKQACEESIAIFESLPTSTEHVLNLSIAYTQLAKIELFDKRNFEVANLWFDKVVELRRYLSNKGDAFYKKMFLETLIEVASIKFNLKDDISSEKYYLEALQLCSELSENDFKSNAFRNGKIHSSIGNLYLDTNRFDKADIYLLGAENIFEALIEKRIVSGENENPQEFYAQILSKRGAVKVAKNELVEALKLYDKSIKMYKNLVEQKPSCFYELAETLTSLGLTFEKLKDTDSAKKNIEVAKNIYETIKKFDPEVSKEYDELLQIKNRLNTEVNGKP